MKTMVAAISAPHHVLFEKDEKLVVEVKFFLPRPRTHVKMGGTTAVSYTHLTLPTILLV